MTNVRQYLEKLPFWDKLGEGEKDFLESNSLVRECPEGANIHSCGDSCLGMTYVISGCVRAYLLSEEGREITLFRLSEGDVGVLTASCVLSQITFETHTVAHSDCRLLIVNADAFAKAIARNVYFRCYMYELAAERFSSVMWTLQQILFLRMEQRLAGFLCRAYESEKSRELRITHEQIASNINSAREVVARVLKRFAADGLVELKRGLIVLTDMEKLQQLKN